MYLEFGCELPARDDDFDESECEGDDNNGKEKENGNQKIGRYTRKSMGHVAPFNLASKQMERKVRATRAR